MTWSESPTPGYEGHQSSIVELFLCQGDGRIPRVHYPQVTCRGEEIPDKLLPRWLSAPYCFQKVPRRMLL